MGNREFTYVTIWHLQEQNARSDKVRTGRDREILEENSLRLFCRR